MRKALLIALAVVIVVALTATLVSAQCGGRGRMGRGGPGPAVCPMGGGQGMGMAGGQRMGMGGGQGMGMGACWMNAQPQTPAQKQFVDQVRGLHDRIRAEQAELVNLQATNSNSNRIAALQNDLAGLRVRLHDLMWNNRPLMQQMGVNGPRYGMGPRGQGAANCIAGCTCPCANGGCIDPAKCADCPCKDNCPCYAKCTQGAGCPMRTEGQLPCKQSCPVPPTQ